MKIKWILLGLPNNYYNYNYIIIFVNNINS